VYSIVVFDITSSIVDGHVNYSVVYYRQESLKPRTAVKTQTCIGLSWTWAC
jgi:hypothetical protein